MNPSGDAAEQVVRMSLEGMEVAARISGRGAERLGVKLFAVLKEEQKTKGKTRLTSMLKSGRELKVFSIQKKDLKTFHQETKRYGVLYCALKDKNASPESSIDIIARAEDASKIQRITEKFKLIAVEKSSVTPDKTMPEKENHDNSISKSLNPNMAKTEKDPPSAPDLVKADLSNTFHQRGGDRASVREKLDSYREKRESVKEAKVKAKEKGKDAFETLASELAKLSKETVNKER